MTTLDHFPTGTPVDRADLLAEGFARHQLDFLTTDFTGRFCEWNTLGNVPDSGGLYAFVLHRSSEPDALRVPYVGLTTHLWMVTKGHLPRGGGGRGGNRYGRHEHAGATRVRINAHVATAKRLGWEVEHWLSPREVPNGADASEHLRSLERALIARWQTRSPLGWNRTA